MSIKKLNLIILIISCYILAESFTPSVLQAVPCSNKKAHNRRGEYQDCKLFKKGKVFFGGKAPKLLKMDLVKKGLNTETDKYVYQYKALIERAGKEKNGSAVLFRANNYGNALARLLKVDPADKALFDVFFPVSVDKRAFPPVEMEYLYLLWAREEGGEADRITIGSRKAKTKRKFIEYMDQGLEPGNYIVTLDTSVDMKQHEIMEMYNLLGWFQFVYDIPGSLTSSFTDWFSATGLAKKVLRRLISEAVFTSSPMWKLVVKSQVPRLTGMKPSDAIKLIEQHSLKYFTKDKKKCSKENINKVVSQWPAPKKLIKKDRPVTLTICRGNFSEPPMIIPIQGSDRCGTSVKEWYCPGLGFLSFNGMGGVDVIGGTGSSNERWDFPDNGTGYLTGLHGMPGSSKWSYVFLRDPVGNSWRLDTFLDESTCARIDGIWTKYRGKKFGTIVNQGTLACYAGERF